MGERRVINGNIYEQQPDGSAVLVGPANTSVVPPSPIRQKQVQAGIANDQAGAAHTNAQTPFVAPQAVANINRDNAGASLTGAQVPKAIAESGSAVRLNGLPPATYAQALKQYNTAGQLDAIIAQLEAEYPKGPGSTHGLAGVRDWIDPTIGQGFDTVANQARGISRSALGLTGGENNTAQEMNMNLGAYVPKSSNLDSTILKQLEGLKRIRDNARTESIQMLGGIPDASGNIVPLTPFDQPSAEGVQAATGAMRTIPDQGMNAALEGMIRQGASYDQVAQFAASRNAQPISRQEYDAVMAYKAKHPDYPGSYINATKQVPVTRSQKISASAPAAGVIGAGDSLSLGALSALAPEQVAAAGANNPLPMGLGQIGGAILATKGIGGVGESLANKFLPRLLQGGKMAQFGRNLATDTTYGAGYGGVSQGEPVNGALAAGIGSGLGQGAGHLVGAGIGGIASSPAVQALRNARIPMTVGQTIGGIPKTLEDAMTSIPGVGDMIKSRRLEGLRAFNSAALNEAGAPVGAKIGHTGEQGVNDLLEHIGKSYDSATAGANVPLDQQFNLDMAKAGAAGGNLPADLAAKFDAAGANRIDPIVKSGQMSGEQYQQAMRGMKGYRAEHTKPGFEQDYRSALGLAMDALTGQMRRGGGDHVVTGLNKANDAYRSAKAIQRAVTAAKNGTGSGEIQIFTPAQLNTAVTQAATKYPGARPLAGLVDAGQSVLPSSIPDSGTARRAMQMALPAILAGGGAGVGYAGGNTEGGAKAGLALGALLTIGGTKAGQELINKALTGRPAALKALGTKIRKHTGLFGAAAVPFALESSQ